MLPKEQWRRNRLAINLAAGFLFAGFTFVMPFLPLYVRELGVRDDADVASWSGLLITVAPLIAGLLGPAWGRLGDRYGMKIMVQRATLALAIHWAFFGFARSPHHLLALRVFLGFFGGFGTLSMPLLAASTPREHLSRSIGGLQTVQMVAAAVGPLLGGALADAIGIRNTCLVSTAAAGVAAVMISILYREPRKEGAGAPSEVSRALSWRQVVSLPSFGTMALVMFTVSFVERSFSPVVPLYVLTLGTPMLHAAKTAGLIISAGLAAEAVSATVMGQRLRTRSPRSLLLWRLAGGAVACLPMSLVSTSAQLLALRLALGLLAGGCMVVVYTLGSRILPAESRGTTFSFLSSSALIGGAAGPVVAGAITHLNMRAIFVLDSVLFLGLLAAAWRTIRTPSGSDS